MGSQAISGKFAILKQGNSVPPLPPTTWTALEEVFDIGEVNINRTMYDVTFHDPSIYRSQIPGVADVINIVCSLNHIEDQYLALRDLMETGTLQWWRIEYPDSTTHEFKAYVGQVSSLHPLDDRLTYTITLGATQGFTFGDIT